jgi:chorismate synthase
VLNKKFMAGNTFGDLFRITTFGESHGTALGLIIDGCPPNLVLDLDFIQNELDRRRPGQSKIVTQRKESDSFEILAGVFEGKTTGAPLSFVVRNENQKSTDYEHIKDSYRPSHADFTYQEKYGHRDYRGGGRSSARETVARVIGGAVAKLLLKRLSIDITAFVSQVGSIQMDTSRLATTGMKTLKASFKNIEATAIRCPELNIANEMIACIDQVRKEGDTIGGVITTVVSGVPTGWGEPAFNKLHADLGKAMLSINACKGFEYGSGFEGVSMKGSAHNDAFYKEGNTVVTKTNYSGGIQGGISNGQDIYFRVAFKPVATIMQKQESVNKSGDAIEVMGKGRHDPCVLPRAVPIVESMAALVLVDHYLKSKTIHL